MYLNTLTIFTTYAEANQVAAIEYRDRPKDLTEFESRN